MHHDRRSIATQSPQERHCVGRCRAVLRDSGRARGAGRPSSGRALARRGRTRGPAARSRRGRSHRLQRRALRGAAGRRPALAAGPAPSRLVGNARRRRVRPQCAAALPGRGRPGTRNPRLAPLRRGLPHAQRLDPAGRRRQAAGDGLDPRRRLHLRIRLTAHLLRRDLRTRRRPRRGDRQLPARAAGIPLLRRGRRRGELLAHRPARGTALGTGQRRRVRRGPGQHHARRPVRRRPVGRGAGRRPAPGPPALPARHPPEPAPRTADPHAYGVSAAQRHLPRHPRSQGRGPAADPALAAADGRHHRDVQAHRTVGVLVDAVPAGARRGDAGPPPLRAAAERSRGGHRHPDRLYPGGGQLRLRPRPDVRRRDQGPGARPSTGHLREPGCRGIQRVRGGPAGRPSGGRTHGPDQRRPVPHAGPGTGRTAGGGPQTSGVGVPVRPPDARARRPAGGGALPGTALRLRQLRQVVASSLPGGARPADQ